MPLDRVATMILVAWIGDADSRNPTGRRLTARRNAGQPAGPISCVKHMAGVAQQGVAAEIKRERQSDDPLALDVPQTCREQACAEEA